MVARTRIALAETVELPPLGKVLDFLRLLWAVDHGLNRTSKRMEVELGVTGAATARGAFHRSVSGHQRRSARVDPAHASEHADRDPAPSRASRLGQPALRSARWAPEFARAHHGGPSLRRARARYDRGGRAKGARRQLARTDRSGVRATREACTCTGTGPRPGACALRRVAAELGDVLSERKRRCVQCGARSTPRAYREMPFGR